MIDQYGKTKGTEFYYRWVNKHGYDDTKPIGQQKSKASATGDGLDPIMELFDDQESGDAPPEANPKDNLDQSAREVPIHDGLDRLEAKEPVSADDHTPDLKYQKEVIDPKTQKGVTKVKADDFGKPSEFTKPTEKPKDIGKDDGDIAPLQAMIHIPTYKFNYTAAPKPGFTGDDGPIIIKSLTLEEGLNINGWRVLPSEFERVAAQYKAGRHLRINHSKNMEDVIGKSFDAKVIKGIDVQGYLGLEKPVDGIDPNGLFVATEFEANPRDPQVRTNILTGYVETGSIGLDAKAFCEECNKPLKRGPNDEMERTCRHFEAPVYLQDVDVKEYSYVAEPAFEHTKAFPTFSAAVSSLLGRSSLLSTKSTEKEMSASDKIAVEAAKTPPPKDGDDVADADAKLQAFKDGYAEAFKHFAKLFGEAGKKAEAEGEAKKGEADAGAKPVKTDQISRVSASPQVTAGKYDDLFDRVWNPTKYQVANGGMAVLALKASAEAPTAPNDIRNKFKGAFS